MSAKECKKIDLNIISGSRESFRNAVGGYWQIVSSSTGEVLLPVDYNSEELLSSFLSAITGNVDLEETISDSVIVPNKRFPIRLIGDPETILDDNHWERALLGGTFEDIEYKGIYSDAVYNDYSFDYSLPYSAYEEEVINYILQADTDISNTVQISYMYNHYLPKYEEHIERTDERLIPNMYLLKMFELDDPGFFEAGIDIYNFVTLEDTYEIPEELLKENDAYFSWEDGYRYANDMADSLIYQYLTSSIILNTLSASTTLAISTQFENIIFDDTALHGITGSEFYAAMHESTGMLPMYMKFNWTADHTSTTFVDYIETNQFASKFMKTLKEAFNDEIDDLTPRNLTYAVEISANDASLETETIIEGITTQNTTYKSIDFIEMLFYAYNNFNSTTDNCYFAGPSTLNRRAVMNSGSDYRFLNTDATVGTLNDVLAYCNNINNFEIQSIDDLYTLDPKYHETLAYRIEKIGGVPTGDSRTQNVLQNFWFFNVEDFMEGSEFYDSQVKYNENYTYNIYAYVLVVGPKYSFSDLTLTRQLGNTLFAEGYGDEASSDSATLLGQYVNCLEFYDPTTDEPAVQLFSEDDNLSDYNEFATNAQIVSEHLYLADFYLNYESSIKLLELPLYSKTLKILDNAPNRTDIGPFQMMDTSQRIGFTADYEVFEANLLYPSPITSDDITLKEEYLHANDFLSSSYIDLKSISEQRYVEVFRTDILPTGLSDFANKLIKSEDLLENVTGDKISTIDFLDRISTNKKYYYVFRALNEQGVPGHVSEIYESQLINDGGYYYSIFNILFESDLEEKPPNNPSKTFKKIFQLKPNISQLTLNTDEVDFDEAAYTQLENISVGDVDDTIFGKTFKIRLSSKKTGKLIDLNITYNLTTE